MTLPSGRSPLRPNGVVGRLYPILVLHACLLPLNVFRLRQVRGLVQAVRSASDEDALQALVPYMRTESHAAGEMLFRRGDPADKLYMIQRGRVSFPEIGKQAVAVAALPGRARSWLGPPLPSWER